MKAASRQALEHTANTLDETLKGSENASAVAAQIGTELFLVVDQLEGERSLRVAVADTSLESEQRAGIMNDVFGSKVAEPTAAILREATQQEWSNPRELREGLVALGRRALLRAAQDQGQLETVENELYTLSRIIEKESELAQLLSDRTAPADQKRSLLANVLYGKVTVFTEALALQVIGRPEKNPVDDIAAVARDAAALTGKTVAEVAAAEELTGSQREALAAKLGHIYGREIAIHSEVDPSLLGGMTIRVGDEIIDGSTRGKLDRLRAQLANTTY